MPFWSRKAKDLVCGMEVDRNKAAATFKYRGDTYYFCSSRCRAAFARKPRRHLKRAPVPTASASGSCH